VRADTRARVAIVVADESDKVVRWQHSLRTDLFGAGTIGHVVRVSWGHVESRRDQVQDDRLLAGRASSSTRLSDRLARLNWSNGGRQWLKRTNQPGNYQPGTHRQICWWSDQQNCGCRIRVSVRALHIKGGGGANSHVPPAIRPPMRLAWSLLRRCASNSAVIVAVTTHNRFGVYRRGCRRRVPVDAWLL